MLYESSGNFMAGKLGKTPAVGQSVSVSSGGMRNSGLGHFFLDAREVVIGEFS